MSRSGRQDRQIPKNDGETVEASPLSESWVLYNDRRKFSRSWVCDAFRPLYLRMT